eukprot:486133-Rhodomonas_salina.2
MLSQVVPLPGGCRLVDGRDHRRSAALSCQGTHWAMSGADVVNGARVFREPHAGGSAARRLRTAGAPFPLLLPLSSFIRYAMSGTGIGYAERHDVRYWDTLCSPARCPSYVMSGTDIGYAAPLRPGMFGTDIDCTANSSTRNREYMHWGVDHYDIFSDWWAVTAETLDQGKPRSGIGDV